MGSRRDRVSVDRLKWAHLAEENDSSEKNVCYDRKQASDWLTESRDTEESSEIEQIIPPQPLLSRGRPTREASELKREPEQDADELKNANALV